jgi:replicative DNA helicase
LTVETFIEDGIELVIIKALLTNINYALKVFATLPTADIFENANAKKLYKFTKEYYSKYNKLPSSKIIDYAAETHEDLRGFWNEVNQLDDSVIENLDYITDSTVKFIKNALMKRAILSSVDLIKSPDKYGEIEKKVREAMEVSFDIYLGMSYKDSLAERIAFARNYNVTGISTGISQFDDALKIGRGTLPKNIYVIASESNLGKSIVLCNMAGAALTQQRNVLFISLEMQEHFLAQRIDAILTHIGINDIYDVDKEKQLRSRFGLAEKQMGDANLFIKEYPPGSINIQHIRALINDLRMYNNFVPEMIIVDYINLMMPARDGENRYHQLKYITEELRALSYEFNAPVITAAQVNREGYNHAAPSMDMMGESMGIVHTADCIVMLSQSEEERMVGQLNWHVVKNRLGERARDFPTSIDYNTLRIFDWLTGT